MSLNKEKEYSFWDSCEQWLQCHIPKYLKHLLVKTGYRDAVTLKTIDQSDIEYIESYGKKLLAKYMKDKNRDQGLHHDESNFKENIAKMFDDPNDFEIVRGDQKLLLEVAAFANDFLKENQRGEKYIKEIPARNEDGHPSNLQQGSSMPKEVTEMSQVADSENILQASTEATECSIELQSGLTDIELDEMVDLPKLRQPLLKGWKREIIIHSFTPNMQIRGDVYYYAPDSQMKLKNISEIQSILEEQSSNLTTDHFSFSAVAMVGSFLQPCSNANDTKFIRITDVEMAYLNKRAKVDIISTKVGSNEKGNNRPSFRQQNNLREHSKKHTREKLYICDVCKTSFKRRSNLNDHLKIHTGEKPFICEVCKTSFRHQSSLKNHLKIHTGEKPYICEVCKTAFRRRSVLKNHLKIHTGEKPYICEVCKTAFRQLSHLKNHLKIHTGEKRFICELCKKSFGCHSSLKVHSKIHTGEKPFKKTVKQKYSLSKRIEIHTDENSYNCKMCNESFRYTSDIYLHSLTHNGENQY